MQSEGSSTASNWPRFIFCAVIFLLLAALALAPDWRHLPQVFSLPPLLLLLVVSIALGLAWAASFRKLNFRSWRPEYQDLTVIAGVLSVALLGGIHLVAGIGKLPGSVGQDIASRIITLWALAYGAAGFLTGFLFGIPRVLQSDAKPTQSETKSGSPAYEQRVNTNLEQISDWLTKIIVGLGLVELRAVPDHLYTASNWMAQSIMPKESATFAQACSLSSSIIVFFLIIGFLAGYLLTRLFLAGAFRRADVGTETKASGASKDDAADKLRTFWRPNGKDVDAGNEQRLLEWMKKNGLISPQKTIDIASLIVLPNLATERANAVRDLNIQ